MRALVTLLSALALLALAHVADATDTPTAADVFAGDSYVRATSSLGGQRHFRLSLVDDQATTAASHRAGWDHAPGTAYSFTWRTWTSGTSPPVVPDGDSSDNCRAEIRSEATVVASLFNAATCPATGATYSWTPTAAGTYRLYVSVVQAGELLDNYNTATGTGGVNDYGALRVGLVAGLQHAGYPSGTTSHAYTIAGETVGLSATHTAPAAAQATTSAQLKVIDPTNAALKTATVSLASTSTSTSFALDDSWPAAACTCGLELEITAPSAFTGTRWTHIASATAPASSPSEFVVRRAGAAELDPRITATHLMQATSSHAAPPMSANDADDARYSNEIAYIATRFTNARGEGLAPTGFAFTSTLRDAGLVVPLDGRSQGTGLPIATQGGQDGWSSLRLFNDGAPTGTWTKTVDVTGPAAIDADTHLVTATKTYTVAVPEGGGAGSMGDPLKLFVSHHEASAGDVVRFVASEAFLDGTARTGNAAGTDGYLYDPSGDLIQDAVATAELHEGIYEWTYTLGESPELGTWRAVVETTDPDSGDLVTSANTFTVTNRTNAAVLAALQQLGQHFDERIDDILVGNVTVHLAEQAHDAILQNVTDHRDNSLETTMTSDFDSLGFDGAMMAFLWISALIWCLRNAKVFAGTAATIGVLASFVAHFLDWVQLAALTIFVIALWLEATLRDRLYQRWFGNESQRRQPQE